MGAPMAGAARMPWMSTARDMMSTVDDTARHKGTPFDFRRLGCQDWPDRPTLPLVN